MLRYKKLGTIVGLVIVSVFLLGSTSFGQFLYPTPAVMANYIGGIFDGLWYTPYAYYTSENVNAGESLEVTAPGGDIIIDNFVYDLYWTEYISKTDPLGILAIADSEWISLLITYFTNDTITFTDFNSLYASSVDEIPPADRLDYSNFDPLDHWDPYDGLIWEWEYWKSISMNYL